MASLNKSSKGTNKTVNRSGHVAYRLDDKTKLVTMALTTMLGEPKYYGDNTDEMIKLAEDICKAGDGEFVAKLAVWARTKGNLRSVSHALIAVAHRWYFAVSDGNTVSPIRKATEIIASQRGDDAAEMTAAYLALYGKEDKARHPNALRKGIRDALSKQSAYSIAKYQSRNREVKLRDVLRLDHPKALSEETSEAMGKAIEGTLEVPKGWETELSARGNTKEVWDELISENRLGIFAQVRNLRNMINAGADIDPVLENLCDRQVIMRSRMLPFRFLSAYRELQRAGLASTKVSRALDTAMVNACANVDRLPGRTAVLIDTSGSMSYAVSKNSVTSCCDIAATLGAMSAHISDDAWVCEFNTRAFVVPMTGTSIISDISRVGAPSGGTYMSAGFDLLMMSGFDADRVIVLSDNEVNGVFWHSGKDTIQHCLEDYRRKVGHDVWCHAIDLQGYGTSQFWGPKTSVITGWSDQVLRFISLAENGFGSIVDEVEAVKL